MSQDEIERLTEKYGESYRRLITDAIHFLDEREPHWELEIPSDREEFIRQLVTGD
jgi:hypothetical protein